VAGKGPFGLSTSIGLASYTAATHRPMELFETADKRMYEEKSAKKKRASEAARKK
jgi:GGDEF domain-containing protein